MKISKLKNTLSSPIAFVVSVGFVIFATTQAWAGAGSSGGGDARCAEYSDLAIQISNILATAGQYRVDQINPTVRVDEISRIAKNLRCLPVAELDRQARSHPEDGHTDLLVDEWQNLNADKKLRLTTHELFVFAGYESDGEYILSQSILSILQEPFRIKPLASVCDVTPKSEMIQMGTYTYDDSLGGYPSDRMSELCRAKGADSYQTLSMEVRRPFWGGPSYRVFTYVCLKLKSIPVNTCKAITTCRLSNRIEENVSSIEYWFKSYQCKED